MWFHVRSHYSDIWPAHDGHARTDRQRRAERLSRLVQRTRRERAVENAARVELAGGKTAAAAASVGAVPVSRPAPPHNPASLTQCAAPVAVSAPPVAALVKCCSSRTAAALQQLGREEPGRKRGREGEGKEGRTEGSKVRPWSRSRSRTMSRNLLTW